MSIIDKICSEITTAFNQLFDAEIHDAKLEKTNANFSGDFTFVVFPYLRLTRKKPEETAEMIGKYLVENVEEINAFNVVKGFLNLELSSNFWNSYLHSLCNQANISIPPIGQGKRIVIEYSSPNTNKPLHLGHVRNNVLGYSVSQIMAANGYDVVKTNLVNDRGVHICKSMLAWKLYGNGETPSSAQMKGDHFVGKYYVKFASELKEEMARLMAQGLSEEEADKASELMMAVRQMLIDWENGEPEVVELWKTMNAWVYEGFEKTYSTLGVDFDKIYYESDTYLLGKELVVKGLEQNILYQKEDGSIWADLSEDGLDQKLLLRGDGTSVYMTQDMGSAVLRYEDYAMDRSVYVVGNEQDYHFKVLKIILQKLGEKAAKSIEHLSYGMVDLPSGKMKSREGTVVDADDLMEEMIATAQSQTEALGKTEGMDQKELSELYRMLGLGALKYFLLKVDAKNRMLFNPEESIDFQGNTGPFIQYTHTRIASLLRAADLPEFRSKSDLEEEELELVRLLFDYPGKVNEAGESMNPAIIANTAFELAKTYNKFYQKHSILGAKDEDVKAFRMNLSAVSGRYLKHAFDLLGIDMPERM